MIRAVRSAADTDGSAPCCAMPSIREDRSGAAVAAEAAVALPSGIADKDVQRGVAVSAQQMRTAAFSVAGTADSRRLSSASAPWTTMTAGDVVSRKLAGSVARTRGSTGTNTIPVL